MFTIKGKNDSIKTDNDPADRDQTIDEHNAATSGLARETVSSTEFDRAINSTVRSGSNNNNMAYAYSNMKNTDGHPNNRQGAPSLFNEYALLVHPRCNTANDYYDTSGADGAYPKYSLVNDTGQGGTGGRYVTVESLLEEFSPSLEPSRPYYVSDFLYNKYHGKIPLNRLITLRRFPFPTYDNLEFGDGKQYKPLAQAVSYFGEPTGNSLSDLTKIDGFINWQELEANVHDVDGNEVSSGDTPFIPKGAAKVVAIANGKTDLSGRKRAEAEAAKKYSDPSYTGRTLGPVNVVNKTHIRDRGIGANQEFSIIFEYELSSYNMVNPRVAMIDIICNMLAITFNNAKFWGGANRYFPSHPQFGFVGDQDAFYRGDYGTYIDSFIGEIGTAAQTGIDFFKGLIRQAFSGNFKDIFTSIVQGLGGTMLDLKAAKSRPQVLGFKALLTGLPVGEWHLTIGNPTRPIMTVGNLICTGFEMELGEELGLDDFPTEMKWTINLKYGRPRDKGDVESVFGNGNGRMYYSPAGVADALNLSAATETVIKPDNKSNVNNRAADPTVESSVETPSSDIESKGGRGDYDTAYLKKLQGTVF